MATFISFMSEVIDLVNTMKIVRTHQIVLHISLYVHIYINGREYILSVILQNHKLVVVTTNTV